MLEGLAVWWEAVRPVVAYGRETLGVFLTGVAVKLMDDHLDREKDRSAGLINWSERLGRAALPYALTALLIATALDPRAAISFFFASYALGMGRDLGERLPTVLKGYQEIALALLIGIGLAGVRSMALALTLMGAVQFTDDLLDRHEDLRAADLLWVIGRGLGAVSSLALGLLVDWPVALMVGGSWGLVSLIGRKEARFDRDDLWRGEIYDDHRPGRGSLPGRTFQRVRLGGQDGTRPREGGG